MRYNIFSRMSVSQIAIAIVIVFASHLALADVLKIVVDDTIHPIVAEHIDRAIQEASSTHADALLIELRTPGGLMTSMEQIIQKVLASPVPVIIYVTPAGADASSAGFFILESADIAAMAPGTNAGAAHPVRGDGGTMDPVMKEKLENYAASLMRSYTGKRGRNVEVAESAVRQSKSFTADEALSQKLIDYIAKDQDDLFRQLEGKTITRFDGSKTVLHLVGKPIHVYEMTLRENVLTFLMNPSISFMIFALGLLCIYVEFNHPGAIVPGVVGFVAVAISLYTLDLLPLRSMAVVMILAAFILFILEAKFQTHGIMGIGGVVMMVLGGVLLVDGPIPQMRVQLWAALSVAIPVGAISIFLMSLAIKARNNKVVTGEQGMVDKIAIACTALMPSGKVFVHGELWNAVASANVEAGAQVVVRSVDNLVLRVDPVSQAVPQVSAVR